MNILIIQGPNLNLLGLRSSQLGQRLTLDKINTALRRQVRNRDIQLKIFQTHRIDKVITLIQRQRNWLDGILLAPTAWARYEYLLKETLELIQKPVVQLCFDKEFNFGPDEAGSILTACCQETLTNEPMTAFTDGLDYLIRLLDSHR